MYNILSEEFDKIIKVSTGLIFVIKDSIYYLLDKCGEISKFYSKIEDCGNFVSYVKQIDAHRRQCGKISTEGVEYDKIDLFRTYQPDGYYTCKKIEKGKLSYGYIDADWNILIPFIFSSIEPFRNDFAKVHIRGQVALINKMILSSGEPHFIIKPFNGDIAIYSDRRFVKIINYDLDGEGIIDIVNEFDVIKCTTEQKVGRLKNEDIFVIKNVYEEIVSILNRYGQEIMQSKYRKLMKIGLYICLYQDREKYSFYSKEGVLVENVPHHYVEQFHQRLEKNEDDRCYSYRKHRRYRRYEDETPSGCGEGWSCSNCPNAGCPANELN